MTPKKIDYILVDIFQKLEEKNIDIEFLDVNIYSIKEKDVNLFLKVFFKKLSKNKFCFNVIRKELDLINIEIYHNNNIQNMTLNVIYDYDIENEKNDYINNKNRLIKQKIFPVVGPDGVGKTTLLRSSINFDKKNIIYKRFKKIVRRSIIYNLLYPITRWNLKRKLGFKPEKDQHDDTYYILCLIAGLFYYPYLLYLTKIKKQTIIIDRFFNDYFLENISFLENKTLLRKHWRNLLEFVPKVYWQIQLDAKPKIILSRKDELKKRDVKKYKQYNFKMYLQKPSIIYTYINTGLDIEDCKEFLQHTYDQILDMND